jgi:23S rRNA pseudouridine1911/1915/1917 synthase
MAVTDSDILYEDNHIILINKKVGEIVQGDKTGDTPLSEDVKTYLKNKYSKPGNVFCGVAHRLDRPVSGLVIFAKTGKALSRLNDMFRTQSIDKMYWAVVKNPPPTEKGSLTHWLVKNEKQNKSTAFEKEHTQGKKAILHYELKAKSDVYCLMEIKLETGRHHQIRAQLSAIGCPIKGDVKYGFDRPNKDAGISLHSRFCSFIHPVSKEPITVTAPVPDDSLWNFFEAQLLS